MHVYNVVRRPLITEKGTALQAQNKYVFEVDRRANKIQIKEAVEKAFNVEVKAVNVCNMPGKMRQVGKSRGMSPAWKKAIVTLKEGQKIEFFEGV